ncbi:response regulator transcription factor [Geobacter sp. FeAm09]|uniref:response regulator transcription factor n=1 Tax=Geobacter sp. FeAm09 TaxID=2597769 RepID=UPI0011EE3175|nr:response regulator transcription factor [Geobacter sp. FeAm09]QEM69566.1 response regulator transcription factor [Geobacter sp. FeAm09]
MADETGNGTRVFLIDDHPAVRQGLALLLGQKDYAVCGEAGSRAEALEMLDGSPADMALVDLSLGEESGLDLVGDLHARGVAVLIYSMHEDAETIERAFTAGADGYVTKREVSDVLLEAVGDVLAGRRHVSPNAAQSLANRVLATPACHREGLLSERERQIMTMIGLGDTSTDIATSLAISVRTVETYYARIMEKLDLDGMKALRRHAIQHYQ